MGHVRITQPLDVVAGTSLKITGSATFDGANVVDGDGSLSTPMFFVEDSQSSLWLEGVSLTGGGGLRGGVVAAYQNASVTLIDCEVYGNAVSNVGGAIFLQESRLVTGGTGFVDNSADKYGGAVFVSVNSTVTTEEGSFDNVFRENAAKSGGAIFVEDSSQVDINGSVTFAGNKAKADGGAIYARRGSTVTTNDGFTSFVDNESKHHGGAIMVCERSGLRVAGNTTFSRNTAEHHGGGIQAMEESYVYLMDDVVFDENVAGSNGGAIHASDRAKLKTTGNSRFVGNRAQFGGAIHGRQEASASLGGDLILTNNTASYDGGAVYLVNAMVKFKGKNFDFWYNNALEGSGGAIYVGSVSRLRIKDVVFFRNVAMLGGAVATFSSGTAPVSSSESDPAAIDEITSR
ncbi:conserved unknown protein [Ectocarpus siliculosus]|uniref:Polymorphic outer membrane protein n=1 Tax=Ectocarpus siliculosus TaxID=2880 RepID=D7FTU1_ECTSI|nr:conserved unknown protein [Ectocarpus siliculosus]|eukprot:CBJ31468.1 conserved unknown protein [Ectocarpus siliculosus]